MKKICNRLRWDGIHRPWVKILIAMKLTVIMSLLIITQAFAIKSYSQRASLTLKMDNVTVKDVLRVIEDKSDFYFLYNNDLINVDRKVSIDVKNEKIQDVLSQLFADKSVNFLVKDRQIVLSPLPVDENNPLASVQQSKTIKGKVTDSSGASLPGVSVVIKGTTNGTISDANGNYSLTNVPENAVMQFSFVGMKGQEIQVGRKTLINVVLEEETIGIEEVVAIGYGTQKRVNLTGAISTVSSATLENRPITTIGEGLQGLIPNLNINFSNGDPGSQQVDYNIRGFESINGGSPYILIDGIPMDIQDINPNDIESVTVLKDAAASAIYGARAGFGVILVTTKSGQGDGKINIQYSNETAFSSPIIKGYNPVDNSYDMVTYQNLMYANDGLSPRYNESVVAGTKAYYEDPGRNPEYAIVNGTFQFYGYNNYMDLLIRDFSPSYKNNLSISGGSKKNKYYVSFGNLIKEGLYKLGNDSYSRTNLLIKLEQNVTDWLSLDQKIAVNMIKTDQPHQNVSASYQVSGVLFGGFPNNPVKFPENDPAFPEYGGIYFENLIGYFDKGARRVNKSTDLWMTTGLNLKPVENLNIRSEFSYNIGNTLNQDGLTKIQFIKTSGIGNAGTIFNGDTSNDYVTASSGNSRGYIFNSYAEYELKNLGDHYVKAMAGFNQEWRNYFSLNATGYGLITPALPAISATVGNRIGGSSAYHYALLSAFYRLNYIFKDRYLVELNGRYDGTSRFPEKDRFGFFPSASVGWRISEEGFMANTRNVLDNLKIRLSYGQLGNQDLVINGSTNYYPYIATMSTNTDIEVLDNGRVLYINPAGLISPKLTWETILTKNIGVDFTFFKQRLGGSFDYYIRETKDMLMSKVYPSILATSAPKENGADLKTTGWEFSLGWNDKITNDLSYNLRFSLWDSQSEITKYTNTSGTLMDYYAGQKIGEIWGYDTEGLFQSEAEVADAANQSYLGSKWMPGDVHYKDQLTVDTNGDGIPDEADGKINNGTNTLNNHGDAKIIGNSSPRYSYGLNADINYKKWSLGVFFQGIGERDYSPGYNFGGWWPWDANAVIQKNVIANYWTSDNTNAYWFRPEYATQKNRHPTTRYLQNAAYLRLKSLTLRYSLPSQLIKKAGLSKAQAFIGGQNLWTHSNLYNKRDPESMTGDSYDPTRGTDIFLTYPLQKTYNVGVTLTF
jgi:TonB-linked SusC/RagA family outer membrane protein